MTPAEFWKKVDQSGGPDACWPWTGAKTKAGYGATSFNWKYYPTHKLAYEFTNGLVPDGLCVCHHCDNPPCCNPKHLFQGTNKENSLNMVEKGRQSSGEKHSKAILPNRPRGEGHYEAKVTETQVLEMRKLWAETKIPVKQLAVQFGLSWHTTSKIVRGKTWKHVGTFSQPDNCRYSKLSKEQVLEIRSLRQSTNMSYGKIATRFGVGMRTVADIICRKTWVHI